MKNIEQIENFNNKKFQKIFGVSKVTIFDRLCIFFAYYRNGRTIADIAAEYSLAESTTFDIIRLVENTLLADERFHLPSKRALLKANIKVAVIDATECSIQRPKKNSENSTPAKRDGTP